MKTGQLIAFVLVLAFVSLAAQTTDARLIDENPEQGSCIIKVTLWATDSQGNTPLAGDQIYGNEGNKTLTGYNPIGTPTIGYAYIAGTMEVMPNDVHGHDNVENYTVSAVVRNKASQQVTWSSTPTTVPAKDGVHSLFSAFGGFISITDNTLNPGLPNKAGLMGEITITVTAQTNCSCSFTTQAFPIAYYANGFRTITVAANPSSPGVNTQVSQQINYNPNQWQTPPTFELSCSNFPLQFIDARTRRVTQYHLDNQLPGGSVVLAKVSDNCGESPASTVYTIVP